MKSSVELLWITPDPEEMIALTARVSSQYRENPDYTGLFRYLLDHKHWSPFEMASACVEIVTTRAVSAQLVRHRSFSFQESSQRYQECPGFFLMPARRQDLENRQNSVDDLDEITQMEWRHHQQMAHDASARAYQWALEKGIARECARSVLPMAACIRICMSGSIRSWIHYFDVRCAAETQAEHRDVARAVRELLAFHLPVTAEILGWERLED